MRAAVPWLPPPGDAEEDEDEEFRKVAALVPCKVWLTGSRLEVVVLLLLLLLARFFELLGGPFPLELE